MTSKRLHTILTALIVLLLVGLIAGAYGINSLLGKESDKLVNLKAKSLALDEEEIGLAKAKRDIERYAELEQISKAIVPEDKSQAEAVREIVKIAADNGVKLESVTFPASTLGSTIPTGGSATAKPVPSPEANPETKSLSQLTPVPSITGVYQLTITVTSDTNNPVQYTKFINFLSALEKNRRTAQVSSITLQPDAANRNLLSFSLTLNNYIKP